jgi:hypothetical protein
MEEREILSLIIGCLVMGFVLIEWRRLKRIPNFGILFSCFTFLFASWFFSVFEAIFFKEFLNFCQHLASGLSGILLAVWCRCVYIQHKRETSGP